MSREIVQIKGTRHGLVILLDGSKEPEELLQSLREKLLGSKGFFKGAKFVFQIENNSSGQLNLKELQTICTGEGLIYDPEIPPPAKFAFNTAAAEVAAAMDQTTPEANAPEPAAADRSPADRSPADRSPADLSPADHSSADRSPADIAASAAAAVRTEENSLPGQGLTREDLAQKSILVKHNLRSGQKVIYPGNAVILGDVNPGAEIIAGGNIVVMGVLRGIAHAGASGDQGATITAYGLRPTQLRIAELIGRSPDQDSLQLGPNPEVARVVNGQIVIELFPAGRRLNAGF